ncbi:MAG: electron transport complex subunit E [Victivallaceae bacterium]|nr:electron transport complex subunit E [Victivallaceae bacterium]
MSNFKELIKGLWKENPVFVLFLGSCPTLAVTGNAVNGLGMGLATTFVLVCSNVVISLIAGIVPRKIRIAVYILVIAAFVTVVDMLMQAYAPESLNNALGIFIQLIVVNCIVLGRAEAFASKNNAVKSFFDGLGMGLGFTFALVTLGAIREFLKSGSLFEVKLIPCWTTDFLLPSSAPGAFIILGVLLAGMNYLNLRKAVKAGKVYIPPRGLDCRNCRICHWPSGEEK